jgi:hypothetical protein
MTKGYQTITDVNTINHQPGERAYKMGHNIRNYVAAVVMMVKNLFIQRSNFLRSFIWRWDPLYSL